LFVFLALIFGHFSRVGDPDPGSCAFFKPLDPGMEKNPDPGFGINLPDHVSESLEAKKYLNSFFCESGSIISDLVPVPLMDPETGMEKIRIWDKHLRFPTDHTAF
jgi:hypothetical protein